MKLVKLTMLFTCDDSVNARLLKDAVLIVTRRIIAKEEVKTAMMQHFTWIELENGLSVEEQIELLQANKNFVNEFLIDGKGELHPSVEKREEPK